MTRSARLLAAGLLIPSMLAAVLARAAPAHGSHRPAPYDYCRFRNDAFRARTAVVGVVAPDVQTGTQAYRACTLGRMAANHLGYYRFDMDWAGVEYKPGKFVWTGYDALMTELAVHHISFLPILGNPPAFRTAAPSHGADLPGWYAPRGVAPFARFASLAVKRYGPHGMFWKRHPRLPYYPIRAWQIWNEPSLFYYWEPRPDPAAYTRLLKAAYKAIKRVDRSAEVVTAGDPWYSAGVFAKAFYTSMFHDGAVGSFNALAFQDYAPGPGSGLQRVKNVRQLMNRYGARRDSLWITEFGWADQGPPNPYRAGKHQAQYTRQLLQSLLRDKGSLGLGRIFYFEWRDPAPVAGELNYFGLHTGLYKSDGLPKPVASVVSGYAKRFDR